ncbi:hypothetical protein MJC1_00060 [Methylocystis sp. MJC1]|jgi:hypothetical protein|nr:hypothetical protein MJC1_00060 [Methylocystis sp. MJC1]
MVAHSPLRDSAEAQQLATYQLLTLLAKNKHFTYLN